MTLRQALDIVKRFSHRGDVAVTNDEDTSRALDAINLARRDVLLQLSKRYLRKTGTLSIIQGTTGYTLAADVQKPVLFRYTVNNSEILLKKIETEKEWYELVYNASTNQSRPIWYLEPSVDTAAAFVPRITVFPIPDAAYTVNYTYQKTWDTDVLTVADLTAQIPEIPVHLHNQVCIGGIFYVLAAFDDPKTEIWEARFERSMLKVNYWEDNDLDSLWSFRLRPARINPGY